MITGRRQFNRGLLAGLSAGLLPAASPRPKLMVLLVVEQLRADTLEFLTPQFVQGGFRRLFARAAQFPDCRHLASTFSSSALTTLATGAWPDQHGIVAESWFSRASNSVVPASSEVMLSGTLCAQIAAAAPHTRSFVIARNATQAGLFAGASGTRQFFRNPRGEYTTLGEPPSWLVQFNTARGVETARNAKWFALDARPGAPPLRTLDYDPTRAAEFLNLYLGSPFSQDADLDLAGTLIEQEKLGLGESTDFVCLILGAGAVLGYETGGNDPLQRQLILNLDRQLEALLVRMSRTPGENAFTFVVAGAHGAPLAPKPDTRSRMAVAGEGVAQIVDKALQATASGRVHRYLYPFLYLDPIVTRDPEAVRVIAGRAALEHPGVAAFYTAGGACSTRDAWEQRFRNSFHLRRSGDVMLSYREGYVEDYSQGRGISYGSLYNYDVRVPLCFCGPSFRTGVYENAVTSVDIAPTLARVLGVADPPSAVGRVLSEAIAS